MARCRSQPVTGHPRGHERLVSRTHRCRAPQAGHCPAVAARRHRGLEPISRRDPRRRRAPRRIQPRRSGNRAHLAAGLILPAGCRSQRRPRMGARPPGTARFVRTWDSAPWTARARCAGTGSWISLELGGATRDPFAPIGFPVAIAAIDSSGPLRLSPTQRTRYFTAHGAAAGAARPPALRLVPQSVRARGNDFEPPYHGRVSAPPPGGCRSAPAVQARRPAAPRGARDSAWSGGGRLRHPPSGRRHAPVVRRLEVVSPAHERIEVPAESWRRAAPAARRAR